MDSELVESEETMTTSTKESEVPGSYSRKSGDKPRKIERSLSTKPKKMLGNIFEKNKSTKNRSTSFGVPKDSEPTEGPASLLNSDEEEESTASQAYEDVPSETISSEKSKTKSKSRSKGKKKSRKAISKRPSGENFLITDSTSSEIFIEVPEESKDTIQSENVPPVLSTGVTADHEMRSHVLHGTTATSGGLMHKRSSFSVSSTVAADTMNMVLTIAQATGALKHAVETLESDVDEAKDGLSTVDSRYDTILSHLISIKTCINDLKTNSGGPLYANAPLVARSVPTLTEETTTTTGYSAEIDYTVIQSVIRLTEEQLAILDKITRTAEETPDMELSIILKNISEALKSEFRRERNAAVSLYKIEKKCKELEKINSKTGRELTKINSNYETRLRALEYEILQEKKCSSLWQHHYEDSECRLKETMDKLQTLEENMIQRARNEVSRLQDAPRGKSDQKRLTKAVPRSLAGDQMESMIDQMIAHNATASGLFECITGKQ
jgi:hypothetical protein